MTSTPETPSSGPAATQLSPSIHVKMTADIATSYLGNNPIAPERVKDVILAIHEALRDVHTNVSVVGSTLKDEISSSVAAVPATTASSVAPALTAAPAEPAPAQEVAAPAALEAAPAADVVASEAPKGRRGRRAVTVPEPLADGGRVRRQPRLRAVGAAAPKAPDAAPAPAPAAAEASAPKLPEVAWATTELGLQPTYAPRSAKEVEKIRKAVFVNDYEGKTGGFVRCLEDGQIRRMLKKHLKFLEIPPAEYLAKWGLPADFPLVHPTFSESRANQIKTAGLWEQRRSVRAKRGEQVDFEEPNVKERQRAERAARRTKVAA